MTPSIKLARLLLQLSAKGQQTEQGTHIHCPLTEDAIGLYIGACQQTVNLALADFKNQGLVEQHGSTLVIPSLRALEMYARQTDC
jgi:CRP-like cAMP-binding protein